jgi:hypothetical protein
MAITYSYDTPTNRFSLTGTGTFSINDLYIYDNAHAIGKVTKDVSGISFTVAAFITLGNGVNFADTGKVVIWVNGIRTASGQELVLVMEGASFQTGTLVGTVNGTNGCILIDQETMYYGYLAKPNSDSSTCRIYYFGTTIIALTQDLFIASLKCYDCSVISGISNGAHLAIGFSYSSTASDVENFNCMAKCAIRAPTAKTTINNIIGVGQTYGVWFQGGTGVVKNINLSYVGGLYVVRADNTGVADCYLINCTFPQWAFSFVGTVTGKFYRQYEFDLQVVDNQNDGAPLQGARYRIFDKNGNELTKTGSGYTDVPNVSLSAPPQGGTQATAHAVLDANKQGAIAGFVVDNPGAGYLAPPTVTVDAPANGVRATALTALVGGAVSAITPTTYTDVKGNIPTRCTTRGYYDSAHGDILQDYAPLLLVITKDGYQDYRDEMKIAMKTAYQISMNRVVPVLVGASGKLQVDLMPTNPVNMMLLDVG